MKKMKFNAVVLSRILIGSTLLIVIGTGVGFYYVQQILTQQATRTNHAKIDAELTQDELNRLKNLSSYLSENKDTVDRAAQVVADANQYQYQDQLINDVTTYANANGISIASFTFPVASSTAAPEPSATPTPSGLKRTQVTLAINGNVPYINMMRFLRAIEQNLTKIQVNSLSLTPDTKDPTVLQSPSLIIEVYLR